MARPVKTNETYALQSYVLTEARYKFTETEKRVLYRLVEMADNELRPMKLKFPNDCRKVVYDLWGEASVTMPISDIMPAGDKNYTAAKKALKSMCEKVVEYEDDRVWECFALVTGVKIEKGSGEVTLRIDKKIWEVIGDFSLGYRKYELQVAMNLKSVYSMRMYEMMSGLKTPLTLRIDVLRQMFGLTNKYKQVNDFLKRTIVVAKKELDEVSPYSFNYEVGVGKYGKIEEITFIPVQILKNRNHNLYKKELQAKVGISFDLSQNLLRVLQNQYKFTLKEIRAHREMWIEAQQLLPELPVTLFDLYTQLAANSRDLKSYTIGTVRKLIEQAKEHK